MSIYGNSMAVRLARECNGEYLVLQTLSKKHKCSVRFYIDADRLAKWLNAESREPFFDEDMGNWLRITPAGNAVVCWCDSNDTYTKQRFSLPRDILRNFATGTMLQWRKFVPEYEPLGAHVRLHPEAHIPQNPKARKAFRKALGREFRWQGSIITLYCDGKQDYYFTETYADGNRGICGGLIYSDGRYNVHT